MAKKQSEEREESIDNCGIIMPISTIDGCNDKHWADVNLIISDAIREAGFNPRIVSTSDDCSVIQKNIVQNIYDDKIVVCDVSGRNPNVMFELGMRLAFDKPTIIVIDDKTPYSFDTSVIDHISYPRNLDYFAILEFKEKLTKKICATIESSKDPHYSTFLKQFAKIKLAKIEDKEGTIEEELLSKMDELNNKINKIERNFNPQSSVSAFPDRLDADFSGLNCLARPVANYQSPIAQRSIGDILVSNTMNQNDQLKTR